MTAIRDLAQRASELVGLAPNVVLVVAGMFGALVVASILRITHLHRLPEDEAHSLLLRLRSWWIIAIGMTLVIILGRPAIVIAMALASGLGLREYIHLAPERSAHGHVIWWAYAAVPLQYVWIFLGLGELALIFVPVVAFLVMTMLVVLMREPETFLPMVGSLHWGLMIFVFCFSHVALVLLLPEETNPVGGPIGWFLYLVLLTEFNDICQALWGRPFGKHAILPRVSPKKSWEGFLGGLGCTTLLACILAPMLTPLSWSWAVTFAVMISVAGFFGDVTISSFKRHVGVKDSGTLIPGQGGILDRIDSLTFTAPAFYHLVAFVTRGGAA